MVNQITPTSNLTNTVQQLSIALQAIQPSDNQTTRLIAYTLVATAVVGIFGALNSFYDEKLKDTIENKSAEYKKLLKENFAYGQNTQKALTTIALTLYVIAGAFFVILALLAMFFGYNLKLSDRTAKLEKKNGHELDRIAQLETKNGQGQKQIDELKKELAHLKNHGNLPPLSEKKTIT
ncbi:12942_t:CDS:2 [Ambispora gerdemannii]|uniref:12942_t:CDS:1 n=1 Tax=Ambispora gerdemannii TaxID=144530 RepID=A0A9N8YX28_9GLOM|nr:12942_t:CDS:2 [Ambispora gerdemannii]